MEEWDRLCPGCFAEKGPIAACPWCGYDESERRTPLVLPHRTFLNNQFVVGRVLGKPGGFGITYLGLDVNLAALVAIKEYLPRDYAGRDSDRATVMAHSREDASLFRFGLEQFLLEARTLARFDHPNVVRTRSFFEQNGTAYLVMDYLQGVNLAEYLQSKGGRLTEQQAGEILLPILDGLQDVHAKGFLHRDIKPQNIYVTSNGRPILLDFGAARQAMGERSRSMSVVLTPGFSPYEQYHRRGEQGPWTDIYALAATYYYLLCGQIPADAPERVAVDELAPIASLVPELSPGLSAAIMQALSLEAAQRPQDVFLFRDMILGRSGAAGPPPVFSPAIPSATIAMPPPLPSGNPYAPAVPINAEKSVLSPPGAQAVPPLPPVPQQAGPVSGLGSSLAVPPQTPGPQASAPQQPIYPQQPVQAQQPGYPQPAFPQPPYPQQPPFSPGPHPQYSQAKKSSTGLWVAVVAIALVAAATGWYLLGGAAEPAKKSVPAAAPSATTAPTTAAPTETKITKPTDKQPFEPLPVQKQPAGTTPATPVTPTQPTTPAAPVESVKPAPEPVQPPPAEKPVTPPPAEKPTPPRQQVRPQTPAEKPAAPTQPKREQGSLW